MEKWAKTCLLLCLFGLLKELRPSEFFVTEYMTGPWKNITLDEVYTVIFPVWTYSYLALLVVVFLVTDFLLYKPVIIFEGICFMATWCVLIWGRGIPAMQGVEFLYAAATASQVAYNTYIYAQVPLARFQIVTAYSRAALLTGRCLAGMLGQALVITGLCDFSSLNYISLSFVTAATLVGFFLPRVSRSVYFHQEEVPKSEQQLEMMKSDRMPSSQYPPEAQHRLARVMIRVWTDLNRSLSNSSTLKWSLWWAFATCGYFQVLNYVQSLWETITPWESTITANNTTDSATPKIYNGAVEAVHTLLGALATLAIGYAQVDWSVYGEVAMAAISLFQGAMLYLAGTASTLLVAYITYIAFGVSYCVLITIASSEVAKELTQDSYGLVFGINTFLALSFQTVLTLIVADQAGLALDPKTQFVIYGGYYLVLGGVFFAMAAYSAIAPRLKRS